MWFKKTNNKQYHIFGKKYRKHNDNHKSDCCIVHNMIRAFDELQLWTTAHVVGGDGGPQVVQGDVPLPYNEIFSLVFISQQQQRHRG